MTSLVNTDRFPYQKVIIKVIIKVVIKVVIINPPNALFTTTIKNNRKWIKVIDKCSKVEISSLRKKGMKEGEITMDDIVFATKLISPDGDYKHFNIIKDVFPEVLILEYNT